MTYQSVMILLDFFTGRNLVEIVSEGRKHPDAKHGIPTQIRARQGLIDYLDQEDIGPADLRMEWPTIILIAGKADGKRRLNFDQTEQTRALEAIGEEINSRLLSHWVDIEIADVELAALNAKELDLPSVMYTHRTLYRVFNNSSFESGGRFYGGWWQQVPSEFRRYITIDGEPTIEMDYSAHHPHLFYAEKGIEFEGDPYDIGLEDKFRPLVKLAFQKLINGKRHPMQPKPGGDDPLYLEEEVGLTWKAFIQQIKDIHKPIADLFGTGIGLRFQREDSFIAQSVMLHNNPNKIPVLPIHDSFIVQEKYKQALEDSMNEAMLRSYGTTIPIKVTQRKPSDLSLRLSQHWQQFSSYDPSQDNPPEPELTNHFVPGYEGYQRRVGQMIERTYQI